MRRFVVVSVLALVAIAVPGPARAGETPPGSAAADLVRPFVGTQNEGNTFPGVSAPFGMAQVSPDTGGQGGYDYRKSTIYGFSQTHLSGVGCGAGGDLPIMPTTGPVTSVDPGTYRSAYSHDDETATLGYYRVGLSTYGVNAELAATERTGWQRYTFPATGAANVLFNTAQANQRVIDSEVHVIGDRTVEGRVRTGGFCGDQGDQTMYFSASFDRPFAAFGTWRGTTPGPDRDAAGKGGNGAYVTFDATTEHTVVLKVGLSYTGIPGARANLAAETGAGYDFDGVRDALRAKWVTQLAKVNISGGTEERQSVFYTALYHALLHPNLAGDVDGSYTGADQAVHHAADYTPYQNFSLWDTYRPQNQLLELLRPEVARDVALSIVAIGHDGGWLPRWSLANSETNVMTGDPVTPFLVEAWSKGLLKGHAQEAYALLRENALTLPPASTAFNGRGAVKFYGDRGYIPSGLSVPADCVNKGFDTDCQRPASSTLEYAAGDAALSLMAAGLGHLADARLFARRGQWWRNLWDNRPAAPPTATSPADAYASGQLRPRTVDGTWLTPYHPVDASQQFHEGGAYQYQWLVPQDPGGLVAQMGGRRAAEQRLDDFFAYPRLLTDPAGTVREDWISTPYDYYAKATYNPNNEPDLLAPYMYHWVGAPAKTATVVRAAMGLFTTGPDGMTGNDDLGTMSAWYVFSALGLFPTMSGANFLAVTTPEFPEATVNVGGHRLTITAPGVSDSARYPQAVRVNGRPQGRSWIPWSAIGRGGTIAQTVGPTPSDWGTSPADEPPSIDKAPLDDRVHLDASVTPSGALLPTGESGPSEQTGLMERKLVLTPAPARVAVSAGAKTSFTVDIVGQSPGVLVPRVTAKAPDGWAVSVDQPGVLVSRHLPVAGTATLALTAPAGVAAGTYPLTLTVRGAQPLTKTVSLVVRPPLPCAATAGPQCAVDLSEQRTVDGTATADNPGEGNLDGNGWSYDAGLLPPAGPVTWGGVTYEAPDPTGTKPNFVPAKGQMLLVPAARHDAIQLVMSSVNGSSSGAVTVTYTDGSAESLPIAVADWCDKPATGTTAVLTMDHRIKAGKGTDGPSNSLFNVAVPIPAGKQVRVVALPDSPRLMLYAMTLA